MAVEANEIAITREQVYQWIMDWNMTGSIRDYLDACIGRQNLPDRMVSIGPRDDIQGTEIDVLDLLMDDLPSYGVNLA